MDSWIISGVTRHIRDIHIKIFWHFRDIVCEAELHNDEKIRNIFHVYDTYVPRDNRCNLSWSRDL